MSIPSSSSSFLFTSLFVFFILTETSSCLAKLAKTTRPHKQLSVDYYAKSCPQLEQLVGSVTFQQFNESPVSGPATIRLLFHDCFVGGCDASILISSKPGSKELAEKDAEVNKDLRVEGFETIRKAKALVESKCPGVVSCADILVIAARDYVHLEMTFIFKEIEYLDFGKRLYIMPTDKEMDNGQWSQYLSCKTIRQKSKRLRGRIQFIFLFANMAGEKDIQCVKPIGWSRF